MNEYNVSDYAIFSDAVSITNNVNTKAKDFLSTFDSCDAVVSDDGVFLGPAADYCRSYFDNVRADTEEVIGNFDIVMQYLTQAGEKYKAGDYEAANQLLDDLAITHGDFINYYQYLYGTGYGDGTIATSGCGPTSMAMVLTYLTGEEVTPVETAAYGDNNGYYVNGQGTAWSYFDAIATDYGVDCEQMHVSSDNIVNELQNDKTVIMSMGPGTFTKGGHFIVLTGINEDGSISVADPNSEERSNTTYDISVFLNEGKEMWSFC